MQAGIHDENVACAEVRYSIAESVTETDEVPFLVS